MHQFIKKQIMEHLSWLFHPEVCERFKQLYTIELTFKQFIRKAQNTVLLSLYLSYLELKIISARKCQIVLSGKIRRTENIQSKNVKNSFLSFNKVQFFGTQLNCSACSLEVKSMSLRLGYLGLVPNYYQIKGCVILALLFKFLVPQLLHL